MFKAINSRVLHPFLFAVFPACALYAYNLGQVESISFFKTFLASEVLAVLIFGALFFFYRHWLKAGLVTTTVLFVFFSYGRLYQHIIAWYKDTYKYKAIFLYINETAKHYFFLHCFLFFLSFVFIFAIAVMIKKSGKTFVELNRILNFAAFVLLVWPFFTIAWYQIKHANREPRGVNEPMALSANVPGAIKRDIYYILVDGYARADMLSEFYGFDNSEFVSYLRQQGFFVPEGCHSNYAWTALSLSSSLNLKYINYLTKAAGKYSNDLRVPFRMIENNRVVRELKAQGYSFVFFNSTWAGTMSNRHADRSISSKKALFKDEFLRVLAQTTMLSAFDSFIYNDLAETYLYAFKMIETVPLMKEPTFSFVHLMLPHYPFIFDSSGAIKMRRTVFNQFYMHGWEDKNGYCEQVVFLNKKLKRIIEVLLKQSPVEPIIIIQSDHGSQISRQETDDFIRARMANFQAYYFPEGKSAMLYESITPVNTFRVLFDAYFNAHYGLLEDVSYYSNFYTPYAFKETSRHSQKAQ